MDMRSLRLPITPSRGGIAGTWVALASLAIGCALPTTKQNPQPTVQSMGGGVYRLGAIEFRKTDHVLTFPAEINLTEPVIEYGIVNSNGKTHESLLRTEVPPRDVHLASLLLGFHPNPDLGPTNAPIPLRPGSRVEVRVDWIQAGVHVSHPLQELIGLGPKDSQSLTGKLEVTAWSYSGSRVDHGGFVAEEEGSILSLIRDPVALINNPAPDREDDDIHYPVKGLLPPRGTPVRVTFHLLPD
ncbi:MAG TPA: hypothetical protein DCM86_03315 [Verrucomicrobiales bacterium]|nr:hypothetical protein [Verrucomicrobiales bacterium]